jgi:hypothetical protein
MPLTTPTTLLLTLALTLTLLTTPTTASTTCNNRNDCPGQEVCCCTCIQKKKKKNQFTTPPRDRLPPSRWTPSRVLTLPSHRRHRSRLSGCLSVQRVSFDREQVLPGSAGWVGWDSGGGESV